MLHRSGATPTARGFRYGSDDDWPRLPSLKAKIPAVAAAPAVSQPARDVTSADWTSDRSAPGRPARLPRRGPLLIGPALSTAAFLDPTGPTVSATPTTSTTVESRYGVRRPQRGAVGRRGQLPWVSRGSSGIVCRRKDVKTGPATRCRRSGYGKLSTGKFWPQQCQLNCHGSRFRVLQNLESDDYRSGASAGHPSLAQRRPRKTELRQVSATDESCCRPTSTT